MQGEKSLFTHGFPGAISSIKLKPWVPGIEQIKEPKLLQQNLFLVLQWGNPAMGLNLE